jgi:hypothetical protein
VEGVGTVRIQQLRRSYVAFSDDCGDARDGEFELLRIRRIGKEKATLRRSCPIRLRDHVDFLYGSTWRLRLQAKAQKF